jgi:competence protein ComEC
MIRWIPYTFVRTVLFFIGGIALALSAPDLIPERVCVSLVLVMTLVYVLVVVTGRRIHKVLNPGWVGLPLVFLLGYVHLINQTESRRADHLIHTNADISHYKAVVTRFAEEKARTWKMEARVLEIHTDEWQQREGGIVLYFSKQDFPEPFRYGDVLLITGRPQIPEGPANPGEFDYREFLTLKNIYHQHFIRERDAVKVGYAPPSRVLAFAFGAREWAETNLKRFVEGTREQAIASALVLGVTDGLDNELLNAYAATGSMHILAVSGLHISILYFVLLWILKPLQKLPGGRWIVAVSGILILWFYAFITGLSPSVLRAVTMFSFLAIARPWARSTNVYNTLAVSAFCLLLFDPFLIRSVGFQLSYLAVLGIVYLYPRILMLWEPRSRVATEIWKISAVSIAAQIATFPLGLLYFHQFPNYFLLSNLVVVPLSSVILILGLIVLASGFLTAMASVLGFCLGMVIRLLNTIVFALEGIPFSLIENVYVSPAQCGLLILFLLMLLALLEYRRFNYLVGLMLVMMLYASLQWFYFVKEVNLQRFAVYKVPGHTAVDLIDRGHAYFLSDSLFKSDSEKIRYHLSPHRLASGVRHISAASPLTHAFKESRLIIWNGLRILYITGAEFDFPSPLDVDWVVVANNSLADPAAISARIKCRTVVLDSSNSFFFASRFLEAAKLHKLEVHSVLHHGAFISTIENKDT